MSSSRSDFFQMKVPMAARYVVNVQILRFAAAVLVVLAHVGVEIENRAQATGRTFAMWHPFDWGLGVDIFFVISGFIMYYLMHGRFAEPGVSILFLKRRLIRIVPLYWICTTLMLASILAAGNLVNNNGLDPTHILASYAFLPWPRGDGELFPLLSLGWTLNFEMFFYLVFALALCLPKRPALTLLAVCFLSIFIAGQVAPPSLWPVRFWGNSMIGEFLLGIIVAALFLRKSRLTLPVSTVLVICGVALAVLFYQTESYEWLPRLVTGGVPAFLICLAVVLGPPAASGPISLLFARGGDASYALYLTHPFTIKIVAVIAAKVSIPLHAIYWIALMAAITVSFGVHLWLEKPVSNVLTRFMDKKSRRGVA
jgi:peptidoglycan/LPS O-acetylase OafA/YrhL